MHELAFHILDFNRTIVILLTPSLTNLSRRMGDNFKDEELGLDKDYRAPNASLALGSINTSRILQNTSQKQPEYLNYEGAQPRGFTERAWYNMGTMWLTGFFVGGGVGVVEGITKSPSPKMKIRFNSVLNKTGYKSAQFANALAATALIYSTFEYTFQEQIDVQSYVFDQEWAAPALSAMATGIFYKSTKGPQAMVLAGGIGATLALTAYASKSFLPRSHGSKSLMFF